MAKQKTTTVEKQGTLKQTPTTPSQPFIFTRGNYLVMGAGMLLLAIGFILMMGGAQKPTEWDPAVIYGFTRITLSTMFVLLGFGVVLLSIFWKPGKS
ncbi:MAG: DUF3098 domain-containing protein [Chitinophagales bacterium]|nr:DUF3098 domain-containing protein [Chitinophagaceae bacterium]MBP9883691.1 DUF3098 domain-containing protein [Chitinophagales bacterium]